MGVNQDIKLQRRAEEDRLASDILEEARVHLMLKFRFLDLALWRMSSEAFRGGLRWPLATNGKKVLFAPDRMIARFRESFDEVIRDYLHMILHCIFRHPYIKDHKDRQAWDLTCDIIAESVAMDLCRDRFASDDDEERRSALDEIAMVTGGLTPAKVYSFICDIRKLPDNGELQGITQSNLTDWMYLFVRDDHGAWPAYAESSDGDDGDDDAQREEMVEDDENPDVQRDGLQTETQGSDESGQEESRSAQSLEDATEDGGQEAGSSDAPDEEEEDLSDERADSPDIESSSLHSRPEDPEDYQDEMREWEDIAKEIEMNLESFSKEWGEEAGSFLQNLALANRKRYNYTDFLRKFMTVTEQIKLNPEEFDYTYYTFGMDLYGNMPFIEPLEYKESESIHDFVIVIDTSESVSGDLVKAFIEHTFAILQESADFATTVNVHIIQADSKVQHDLKITDVRDIDKIMEGYQIRGFGGTDFRPAFDYVKMLQNLGELEDLKGLIYFTDGLGQFPEKTPGYEVAFVFMDDGERESVPVPPWASKLRVDARDIEGLEK